MQKSFVPVPEATGPIPSMADSVPWLAAGSLSEPVQLAACGYTESEYFLSGTANVYDWLEDGDVSVRMSGAPYTNRILVRRPEDPARCSGRVVVEMLNASSGYDYSGIWGLFDYMTECGDAWVGVTSKPLAVQALKRFDPVRYGALSWVNPAPDLSKRLTPDSSHETEDGLVWDIMSQTGALLKSRSPDNPLAGIPAKHLYLYGVSQSGSCMLTYINALHNRTRLEDDSPVYDGYLIDTGGGRLKPIRQYAEVPQMGTLRTIIRCSAPVINIVPEGDANAFDALKMRRPDGDEPDDRYRMYEIAGCVHAPGGAGNRPGRQHLERIGVPVREYTGEQPVNDFPKHYFVKAALANLDLWVRESIPAPRADRLEFTDTGMPEPDMFPVRYGFAIKDEQGNAVGGVRSPFVDVPLCTYVTWCTPQVPAGIPSGYGADAQRAARSFLQGHKLPFSDEKLKRLYKDRSSYIEKVKEAVDRSVRERWLLPEDGAKIVQDAMNSEVLK